MTNTTHIACSEARQRAMDEARGVLPAALRSTLLGHVAGCEGCRRELGRLRLVASLGNAQDPLDGAAHARILANVQRAARAAADRRAAASERGSWVSALGLRQVMIGGGAVAAAALAVSVGVPGLRDEPAPQPAPVVAKNASAPVALAAGETIPFAGARISAESDAAAVAQVALDDARRTVRLLGGKARFDVTPGGAMPFRVETRAFTVEVLGTLFAVSEAGVETSHGLVRVVGTEGQELARVGAGQRWEASQPHVVEEAPPAVAVPEVATKSEAKTDVKAESKAELKERVRRPESLVEAPVARPAEAVADRASSQPVVVGRAAALEAPRRETVVERAAEKAAEPAQERVPATQREVRPELSRPAALKPMEGPAQPHGDVREALRPEPARERPVELRPEARGSEARAEQRASDAATDARRGEVREKAAEAPPREARESRAAERGESRSERRDTSRELRDLSRSLRGVSRELRDVSRDIDAPHERGGRRE